MHQTKYEYRSPKFAEWPWLFVAVPIAQMVFMFWIWLKAEKQVTYIHNI
jgi:hypothetical protein